jgi:hypothetical protein
MEKNILGKKSYRESTLDEWVSGVKRILDYDHSWCHMSSRNLSRLVEQRLSEPCDAHQVLLAVKSPFTLSYNL